jgi:hypothetical protein
MFSKLIQPAVNVLNRLPFKYKIVVSISVLFLLLILPSHTTFINYIDKKERYNSQFIGLNYVTKIHALIHQIQMHRGLTNGYLSGNERFKKSILKSEKMIDQELANLVAYDRKRLNILHQNSDFVDALARLELIKIKNIVQLKNRKTIFTIHTKIIMQLIDTLRQIAIRTAFANSEDARIITEAIIAFSKKLGSKTVVEYVHNATVYEKVKEMGADYSQGFYLGEPAPKVVDLSEKIRYAKSERIIRI